MLFLDFATCIRAIAVSIALRLIERNPVEGEHSIRALYGPNRSAPTFR
jgi:hypothetical protein